MSLSPEARAVVDELVELFWYEAPAIDAGDVPISRHLDALARSGLYGVFAPVELGGLGLGPADMAIVMEELASACLTSTFVWAQHFRLLGVVLDPESPSSTVSSLRADVVRGRVKGGVALTGLMPGPVGLHARPVSGGWLLDGEAPWVSGWGAVDTLVVLGRNDDGHVVTLLVPAASAPGLSAVPLKLTAANATATVKLIFGSMFVPEESLISRRPYADAVAQGERLRLNGTFPLGVARRALALLGPSPLDAELAGSRRRLLTAPDADVPEARAQACELASRAAHALAVGRGSASALYGDAAERLSREAALLLVFGSRPAIKEALLRRLTGPERRAGH